MKARRALATLILAGFAVMHGYDAFHGVAMSPAVSAFFAVACGVGAVVLVRPTFWARRYAMGIAIAGLLNAGAYFAFFHERDLWWLGVAQTAAFAALFASLLGKRMRATYDELAPHWVFDHPTMHLLAAALSLNVAGIGMLVYYGFLDASWTTPALRGGALCLAAVMSIGSIASARGRIAGLFIMTVAGVASLWLGWHAWQVATQPVPEFGECGLVQAWREWGRWETMKSLVGFAPAALGSILCFGAFLGPMVRFVRNRDA